MKFLKYVGLAILIFLATVSAIGWFISKPIPEKAGSEREAERVADQMLIAIGKSAYDSIHLIDWSFPRGHDFVWEKEINRVTVSWPEGNKVVLYTETGEGTATVEGQTVDAALQTEMIQTAWALFANDSFWLVAPFKIRDPGTSRSLVQVDNGYGLLVTYSAGGVTPGDSYLWILDEAYMPVAWRMWVQIIPIGGLEFSWEGSEVRQGAWFAPKHQGPGPAAVDLEIHRVE